LAVIIASLDDNPKAAKNRVSTFALTALHLSFDKGNGQRGHQLEVKID
jgi:hypothetical protein